MSSTSSFGTICILFLPVCAPCTRNVFELFFPFLSRSPEMRLKRPDANIRAAPRRRRAVTDGSEGVLKPKPSEDDTESSWKKEKKRHLSWDRWMGENMWHTDFSDIRRPNNSLVWSHLRSDPDPGFGSFAFWRATFRSLSVHQFMSCRNARKMTVVNLFFLLFASLFGVLVFFFFFLLFSAGYMETCGCSQRRIRYQTLASWRSLSNPLLCRKNFNCNFLPKASWPD